MAEALRITEMRTRRPRALGSHTSIHTHSHTHLHVEEAMYAGSEPRALDGRQRETHFSLLSSIARRPIARLMRLPTFFTSTFTTAVFATNAIVGWRCRLLHVPTGRCRWIALVDVGCWNVRFLLLSSRRLRRFALLTIRRITTLISIRISFSIRHSGRRGLLSGLRLCCISKTNKIKSREIRCCRPISLLQYD